MNSPADIHRFRTILLLTDEVDIEESIKSALNTYQLANDICCYQSVEEFQRASLDNPDQDRNWPPVDLCLIAHLNDSARQCNTVGELRQLCHWDLVPIVVFLPAHQNKLARSLYELGANSVLSYPLHFDSLRDLLAIMDRYWFDVVSLP